MKISVDFDKPIGVMRIMHAIGQPPMCQLNDDMLHYLPEAGIPYARLHDVQGMNGGSQYYVDIPNLFPQFDADESLAESYDFTLTDHFLMRLIENKVMPFFRLGVTIENFAPLKAHHIFPPKDFGKWARICEHIIRHYNEGWANGFHFGIKYWEIWNEPDDANYKGAQTYMWRGTPEQFYELYSITATHLKRCFGDDILIGGYGSSGFYGAFECDPELKGISGEAMTYQEGRCKFAHGFFQYIRNHQAPLDFFSWHSYDTVNGTVEQARYARAILKKYGYDDVPDILDEWNINPFDHKARNSARTASMVFSMFLSMQNQSRTAMLNYYDGSIGPSPYSALFNADSHEPYLTYFVFKLFNDAYLLANQVEAASEDASIQLCAATDGHRKIILLANPTDKDVEVDFTLHGASAECAEIIMTNDEYRNTLTGKKIADNKITLPHYTCMEIRF